MTERQCPFIYSLVPVHALAPGRDHVHVRVLGVVETVVDLEWRFNKNIWSSLFL